MAFLLRFRAWKVPLGLVALYAVLTLITLRPGDRALYPAQADGIPVYIINNGFHTDIALPADEVMKRGGLLAEAGRRAGSGNWLVYGWGDAGFYTAKGISLARAKDALRALFMPGNPSVIRVFSLNVSPDRAFAEPIASMTTVSSQGFDAMARHIEASFTLKNGAPVILDVSMEDVFFVSHEHFSILRVCNNWTSDQLAAAGLPTAPMIDGNALLFNLDLHWRAGVRKAQH
jgi:uncharacterized protein (TIGR02117 family)